MATIVELIPPTDAHLAHRGRIRGRNLEQLHAKAVERRDAAPELKQLFAAQRWPEQNLGQQPRQRSIFVKPADRRRLVFDLAGQAYPVDGVSVPVSDVYVQRRLRDGSLVRANPLDKE